jgi:hypothetical protein
MMPASKAEQVLEAIKALLETVPGAWSSATATQGGTPIHSLRRAVPVASDSASVYRNARTGRTQATCGAPSAPSDL